MSITLSSAESAKKVYESGYQGFLLAPRSSREQLPFSLARVDFPKLLAHPQHRRLIRALPPQMLYYSLLAQGVEDCLEVLPHISTEQFIRICDYDVWHEDRLVAKRLFTWLGFYRECSPKQMFTRFRSLDEEYQLAVLTPHVRVYTPEEYEKMTDVQQDSLYRFPRDALFYEITSTDQDIHTGIESLIDAAMAEDMNYAISALSHASYQLLGEADELLKQFRRARLEEDGFVTYEESMDLFIPQGWSELVADWQMPSPAGAVGSDEGSMASAAGKQGEAFFLKQVLAHGVSSGWSGETLTNIHRGFLYLSNALCTACRIESDDLNGLQRLLLHTQGLVAVALEVLSQGELGRASKILREESPQRLFRGVLQLLASLQLEVIASLKAAEIPGAEKIEKFSKLHKQGALLDFLDRECLHVLGFAEVELLKGLFNRLPLVPVGVDPSPQGVHQRIVFAPVQSRADLLSLGRQIEAFLERVRRGDFTKK